MDHGRFFVIEGCDGSGKTALGKRLRDSVSAYGYDVTLTHEPAGTDLGKLLTQALSREGLTKETELLIFNAARAQHTSEVIRPALNGTRKVVICDRYADSTRAYQDLDDDAVVEQVIKCATGGLRPVMTFVLVGDVEVMRNRAQRDAIPRYDDADLEQYRRIQERYLRLAELDPQRYCVIDSTMQDQSRVFNIAEGIIKVKLPKI